jgi:hypothetical protein
VSGLKSLHLGHFLAISREIILSAPSPAPDSSSLTVQITNTRSTYPADQPTIPSRCCHPTAPLPDKSALGTAEGDPRSLTVYQGLTSGVNHCYQTSVAGYGHWATSYPKKF